MKFAIKDFFSKCEQIRIHIYLKYNKESDEEILYGSYFYTLNGWFRDPTFKLWLGSWGANFKP